MVDERRASCRYVRVLSTCVRGCTCTVCVVQHYCGVRWSVAGRKEDGRRKCAVDLMICLFSVFAESRPAECMGWMACHPVRVRFMGAAIATTAASHSVIYRDKVKVCGIPQSYSTLTAHGAESSASRMVAVTRYVIHETCNVHLTYLSLHLLI